MAQRALLVMLAALVTLQVSQAETPVPDNWVEEHGDPAADISSQAGPWAASTRWLGDLRSSYSQIIRHETDVTLEEMMLVATNIEVTTQICKDQIEDILAEVDKPNYLKCTGDNNFKKIQEVIATEARDLQKCVTPLKSLHDEYKRALVDLTAEVEDRREDTIYSHCLQADASEEQDDGAEECFNASVQEALSGFYYPVGSTLLSTVTDYRSSMAHAQAEAHACAAASTHAQTISQDLEATISCLHTTRQRVRRGFGKKFKKLFKKAKHGVKKVCSKIPCHVGVSLPFG